MHKKDALAFYKTQERVAQAIGIKQGSVSGWGELIPFKSAYALHLASGGAIPFKPELYDRVKAVRRADKE